MIILLRASTTYSIDFVNDQILRENAFNGFHEAGPNVDKALKAWKVEKDKEDFQRAVKNEI